MTGLNFKLDVGLYRLDQQVACQRIGKTFIDANLKVSVKTALVNARSAFAGLVAPKVFSFATA